MRERYLHQLQAAQANVVHMGERVDRALTNAMKALVIRDALLARQVIEGDREIDTMRVELEAAILLLLATQQPVLATDLRLLTALTTSVGELERAGDYAKSIAKHAAANVHISTPIDVPEDLRLMATLAQNMLRTCLSAFLTLDVSLARSLSVEDEKIDELEDRIVTELMAQARQDITRLEWIVGMLAVAHALERLADRTTNIAERIIFIATSVTEELNT